MARKKGPRLPEPPRAAKTITYKASVARDLDGLSRADVARVVGKLEKALRGEGRKGEALSGKFKGLHKLRVGDYRVIYARTVRGFLILRIAHGERSIGPESISTRARSSAGFR